jgi:hypothetical protein
VLAYREVNLGPRERLSELQRIGDRIEHRGPTLMTEYNPYGARHFLRGAQPEGVSELRRRRIPLVSGHVVHKGGWADTDRLATGPLLIYRTLVLRRSPAQSRPPSPFELTWRGRYYDVWQRRRRPPPPISRLPLGRGLQPAAVPRCAEVQALARRARGGAHLLAAPGARSVILNVHNGLHPLGPPPRPGAYDVWLRGSVRARVRLVADGEEVAEARNQLNTAGGFIHLGRVRIRKGGTSLGLRITGPDLHPGSGGPVPAAGPLVLSPIRRPAGRLRAAPLGKASSLCGARWDWIEAVSR